MGPFDVERFLDFPVVGAGAVRVGGGQGGGLAVLIETVKNDDAGPYWLYSVGPEAVRPNWESKASRAWKMLGSS